MINEALITALLKAQQEISHVVQDAKNPFFKSKYATLKNVIDTVRQPLNENGIYFQQKAHLIEGMVGVETVFYGHGGELSTGIVPVNPAKANPQEYGSALSYAKRYSLSMACGIASVEEDDDGEKAMTSHRAKKTTTKPKTTKQKTEVQEAEITSLTDTESSETVSRGNYVFKGPKDVVISSTDDIERYLELCRKFLGSEDSSTPEQIKEKYIDLYKINESTINACIPRSTGKTKEAFNKIKEFFNEEV